MVTVTMTPDCQVADFYLLEFQAV